MNKLLTKIAVSLIGMSLAIGVGVAAGSKNVNPAYATIPSTSEEAYEVVFATSDSDSGTTAVSITTGTDYASVGTCSNAYARTRGLSLGTSSKTGSAIINLTSSGTKHGQIQATYLSVYAIQWDASKNLKTTVTYTDSTTVTNTTATSSSWTYIDISLNSAKTISSVKFESTTASKGRVAVGSFKVYKEKTTSYTVSYNPVSNSGTGTGTMTNSTGSTITIKSSTFTAPSGKIFEKWNTKADGTGTSYNPGDEVSLNLTLYAIWATKRSVTYYPNSSEGDSNYVTYFPDGGDVTLVGRSDAGFTVPTGKAFNGWNTNSSGTGTQKAAGDVLEDQTSDLEFYAQWIDLFTVTYNGNGNTGGSVPTDSNEYEPNDEVTVKDVANTFVKTGYYFYGWNTATDGSGTFYAPGAKFDISASLTLYAQWVALKSTSTTFTSSNSSERGTRTEAGGSDSMTKDSITVGGTNAALAAQSSGTYTYRFYKDGTTTISAPNGSRLGKIVFTGVSSYAASNFGSPTNGYYTTSGNNGTWYGNSSSVSFTESAQVRCTVITITLAELPDITVTGATSVKAGSTITLTSNVAGVTWTSSNTNIATVAADPLDNTKGIVTGVVYNASSITITASKVGYDSAEHTVSVAYADVTSITLNKPSDTIGLEGSVDLTATILSSKANPAVTWGVASPTLVEDTDYEYVDVDNELTLAMKNGNTKTGTIIITATATGYIDDTETPDLRATCVVTVAGAKSVSLSLDSMSGYAGSGSNHKASITATAQNFSSPTYSWSVVSETVDDMVTFSASTSATTYVNFVKAGTATIKCGCQESGAGDFTYSSTITVTVSNDEVESVEWEGEDITCYSGSTLTASTVESWEPIYTMKSGDSEFVESDYTIKLNGTSYTLGTALSAGTYTVTLTYGGKTTAENNPTLTVIQSLNTITKTSPYSYTFTSKQFSSNTSANLGGKSWTLAGDGGYWGYEADRGQQLGSGGSPYSSATLTCTGFSGTITSVTVNASGGKDVDATVGITVGSSAFGGAAKSITVDATDYTFTGSASGTIVITLTQESSKALYIKSITVCTSNDTVTISNSASHYEAQAAVIEFAQYMNTEMNKTDVCTGDMSKLSTAWGNVADKYDDLFGEGTSLDQTELDYAKDLLANASANWDEDHDSDEKYCLERAMATYEWCVSRYSGTCTAFMSAVRPLDSRVTNPIQIVINNFNVMTIVAVMAMLSFTAFGTFYFLRKKEEKSND